MSTRSRSLLLCVLFVGCWAALGIRARTSTLPPRLPLLGLPMTIAGWEGRATAPLEARVLAVLGVDDHLTRVYRNHAGQQAGLYVGFHASQQQGASIHSPMNCLPGAGWQPVSTGRIALPDRRSSGTAPDRDGQQGASSRRANPDNWCCTWYQSQGRVVASEYAAKAYLFLDAVRSSRSDAALVRIVAPIGDSAGAEFAAQEAATGLATALLPVLGRHLPE